MAIGRFVRRLHAGRWDKGHVRVTEQRMFAELGQTCCLRSWNISE